MTYLPYTGIGSRHINHAVITNIIYISKILNNLGFTLRSGGANGSDTFFELKSTKKEIFLPWKNFNNNNSELFVLKKEAFDIAEKYHPAYNKLNLATKKLMARNSYQILGYDLNNLTLFVVCYTNDGCESHKTRNYNTGGTGQAISIASDNNIPIFNIKNKNRIKDVIDFATNLKENHGL